MSVIQPLVKQFCIFTMSAVKKPEVLFILGGPGAGKGTLCKQLVDKFGCVHLSAGDLLREERAKPGSQYGELIENHIKNGTIVPVEITCSLLDRAMVNTFDTNPHKRYLIDGFPRNQDNLQGWSREMEDKVNLKGVIFLSCSKETCTNRCLKRGQGGSGRTDDNMETLVKRYETYVNDTMPIIEHYEKQGLVFKFNGMNTPEQVLSDVIEKLETIGWTVG